METLHNELNLETMNSRLSFLNNKVLNKMRDIYFPAHDRNRIRNYKYSDYTISLPPLRNRRRTIGERIQKYLLTPRNQTNVIKEELPTNEWQPPPPLYSSTVRNT